jgi:hypothetical protein
LNERKTTEDRRTDWQKYTGMKTNKRKQRKGKKKETKEEKKTLS